MIFVFGSNLAGRHGKGAALTAKRVYGAKQGVGRGRTGNAYALPTKSETFQTLDLDEIQDSIEEFIAYALAHPELVFQLTPVGCGLAGYSPRTIWKLFKAAGLPANVFLTSSWMMDHQLL